LLKEGATLVDSLEDLHRALPPPVAEPLGSAGLFHPEVRPSAPKSGSPARWIYDHLDLGGIQLAELARRWPGSRAAWAEGLMALEMSGLIRRLPGGKLARRIWNP
jgi:hypothetical protein